jgi:hypothetical protein
MPKIEATPRCHNTMRPKTLKPSRLGLSDLESLWQGITWRFESRGARVPVRWRMLRRAVAALLTAGARGWL